MEVLDTSFLTDTCVNWPFSRTHLPVGLTNFSYRPFFGIHMEVLDADLEQIKNRFTVCREDEGSGGGGDVDGGNGNGGGGGGGIGGCGGMA